MPALYLVAGPFLLLLYSIGIVVQRLRRKTIDYLPGPSQHGWMVGNIPALMRPKEMGDVDLEWKEKYGTTLKMYGQFGEKVLYTMDPKALQHILNTSGYHFPKPPDARHDIKLLTGRGIVWAEGTQHARHRKIMNPAFSFAALRVFVPLFRSTAQRGIARIKEEEFSDKPSAVVNMHQWLGRITLDAIGEAAFGCQFHAIDNGSESPLQRTFRNLFPETSSKISDATVACEYIIARLPDWLADLCSLIPTARFKRFRTHTKITRKAAKDIVDAQTELFASGKEGSKDVMAILVKANLSENSKTKLSEEEILSQMTTLFLAGHDTTALTTSWLLYELSRRPDYQSRIRDEIKSARAQAEQRGDSDLTITDLDSMPLMLAAMKEILRFRPILPGFTRVASRDDIIPLSIPQKTKTGEVVSSIPVSKGQRIQLSFYGYHRLKEVWGDDAGQFRPERFLDGDRQKINVGVIGNVLTFSSGLRSCIGWRFAILEMQAILIELLESFEFSPPPGNVEIIRAATGLMTPMIKGGDGREASLPLMITPIQ